MLHRHMRRSLSEPNKSESAADDNMSVEQQRESMQDFVDVLARQRQNDARNNNHSVDGRVENDVGTFNSGLSSSQSGIDSSQNSC